MAKGIYKILNLINNKVYVGSAINLNSRKNQHFSDLRLNKHVNNHLQYTYNKHGECNLKFIIIEYLDNNEELIKREQYWMDSLQSYNDNHGYNICPIAGNCLGKKHSETTKDKLRISSMNNKHALGYKHTEEAKERMRSPRKNKGGGRPKGFSQSEEVKLKLSILLKGRISPMKGKKHTNDSKKKISESRYKKVINITTGEIFNSLLEASEAYPSTTRSSIGSVCAGRYKTASKCEWEFYLNE